MKTYVILISCALLLGTACGSPEDKARKLEQHILEQIPILFADDVLPVVFTQFRTDSIRTVCRIFRERIDNQLNSGPDVAAAVVLKRADLVLQGYEQRAERLVSDPSFYDIGPYIKTVMALNEPMDKRMVYLALQLERTRAYYTAAKANLRPTNSDAIHQAIDIHRNTMRFLQNELPDSIQISNLNHNEKAALLKAVQQSRWDVKDYIAFCRSWLFELRQEDMEDELEKKIRR